jgi:hypothetical protein
MSDFAGAGGSVADGRRLQRVRRNIEVWRWVWLKRSPMPEDLWAQAARLGVWTVAYDSGRRLPTKVDFKQLLGAASEKQAWPFLAKETPHALEGCRQATVAEPVEAPPVIIRVPCQVQTGPVPDDGEEHQGEKNARVHAYAARAFWNCPPWLAER